MNIDNIPSTRPEQDWGLDPVFWVPAKLFIGDLHQMLPGPRSFIYFIGNQHAVRKVEIVGIVVAVEPRGVNKPVAYYIDDGTGTIPCIEFPKQDTPQLRYRRGDTVRVEGTVKWYRECLEVSIICSDAVHPDQESVAWMERLALRKYLEQSPY